MSLDNTIRLNKFVSDSGYCSRREADKLIENNRVRINGKLPELGTRVGPGDEVTIDGMEIYNKIGDKSDRVYLAYNKPVGITCTTEQNVKGNIVDAVDHDERIFPIGRLDKPSEGLILLTSDGDIVNKILRAENAHDKEYLVSVNKNIAPDFASKMSNGIPILGTVTKPCKVVVTGKNTFKITLTQGLNRQIRRMCEYLGYEVQTLKRLRIMNIDLGKLRPGQWRNLTHEEMAELNEAISDSSSEAQTQNKRSKSSRGSARQNNPKNDASRSSSGKSKRSSSPKSGSYSEQKRNSNQKPAKSRKKVSDRSKGSRPSKSSRATAKPTGKPSSRNSSKSKRPKK